MFSIYVQIYEIFLNHHFFSPAHKRINNIPAYLRVGKWSFQSHYLTMIDEAVNLTEYMEQLGRSSMLLKEITNT